MIVEKEKKLTKKEEMFCRFYSFTRNPKEAALRAGYNSFPEIRGIGLLARGDIRSFIGTVDDYRERYGSGVKSGFERVAFGEVNDAVKLLFCGDEISEEELEKLDLFCVSEIKKKKSGEMEIKFFDRLKALEKLGELNGKGQSETSAFFRAVEEGAKRLYSKKGE